MRRTRGIRTTIILLILHTSSAKPSKSTAPAVFEIINEQARMDSKEKTSPYENPLAGNSNAKIHAQHQQAMFNAERYRQHRAQVMRWSNQPPKQQVDSYMQAYHESQENHHLALEQMQATMKEKRARGRPEQRKTLKDKAQMDPIKITRADASKNRNHRSFGSVHTNVIKKYKILTYPGPTYDQGVTIKPNGNVGLTNYEKEKLSLFTEAIPSKTQYDYSKIYGQMHTYQSANDIDALNTLLSKQPQEQLTQFNTLIHTGKETEKDTLETPIDLFFYLKEQPNGETVTSYPGPYAAEYTSINHKDHTPITEEVDDVQDNRDHRIRIYQPTLPTVSAQVVEDITTPKNNYFKPEVEQVVSNNVNKNVEYTVQETPSYETLQYKSPLNYYSNGPSTEGIKYLKTQPTGVQHLSPDGTGVSAYGDNDVSIINSRRKRELDTDLFIVENYTITTEKNVDDKIVLPIQNHSLINVELNCNLSVQNINDSLADSIPLDHDAGENETLPTPEALKRNRFNTYNLGNFHNVGEAFDYDYSYDNDLEGDSKFEYIDENDYDPDYESTIPDYDYEMPRPRPKTRPSRRRPIQNQDIVGSFSTRLSRFRHPKFEDFHPEPANANYGEQYFPLQYASRGQFGSPTTNYGQAIPQYGPPAIQTPLSNQNLPLVAATQISDVVNTIQPVYMLTHAQMKELLSAQKMNIQHLDVFQLSQDSLIKPVRSRRPRRKPRRRYPKSGRKHNKFGKLKKLRSIIRF